jgi:periplasmic protein TonB
MKPLVRSFAPAEGPPASTIVTARKPIRRRDARAHDGLTPGQRRALIAAIAVAHVGGLWALLQVREVRDAISEVSPVFASLIAPDRPPEPAPPPPIPTARAHITPRHLVTAAPSPAPAPYVVAAPPAIEPPSPPAAVEAPPAPAPQAAAVAPAPTIIPASAVQYLEPPVPEYPRLSKRANETGRVLVRVHIDEAGLSRDVEVARSSGHPHLDEAAAAAVRKARFKPYMEGGRAVAGWAFIPIDFELER